MTTHVLDDVQVFHDEFDLTGISNSISLPFDADPLDVTNFGSGGWREFKQGLKMGQVELGAFYDTAGTDAALYDSVGASGVTSVATSSTAGVQAWLMQSVGFSHTLGGAVGEIGRADTRWSSTGKITSGALLVPKTVESSTGDDGTAFQLGALSSTETLWAHLHVFAVTGGGTLGVTVRSDTQEAFGGTPATQITFTNATDVTSERSSKAGAVTDDWWRVTWTLDTGTATFAVVAGISTT